MWILTCPGCGKQFPERIMRVGMCGEYSCPECGAFFQWEPPDDEDEEEE